MDIQELKQIRVTIKDNDALKLLSWHTIKEYLIKNGWIKIRDVRYGSQWQHPNSVEYHGAKEGDETDPDVILLPETTDIADYTQRMSDILKVLEFAADKSQLELYEMFIDGDFLMETKKETICPICDKPLTEEELESPRKEPIGEHRVICDECYRNHYEEPCEVCEELMEYEDQKYIILPHGDSRGIDPGIYKILKNPFYLSDCLGSFEVIREHVKKLATIPESIKVDEGGLICPKCLKQNGIIDPNGDI